MSEGTNENLEGIYNDTTNTTTENALTNLNNTENPVNAGTTGTINTGVNNIENAFSDLISVYFEGNTPINEAGKVEVYETITDIPTNNVGIYTNLAGTIDNTTGTNEGTGILYTNLDTTGVTGGQVGTITEPTTNVGQVPGVGAIYNDIEGIGNATTGTETTSDTVIIPTIGGTNNTTNAGTVTTNIVGTEITVNGVVNPGTSEFKLTQANLPAKIGFWTKVRNFFLSDAKFQYSVQEPTTNTGLWNKVQNFFSFGKNK